MSHQKITKRGERSNLDYPKQKIYKFDPGSDREKEEIKRKEKLSPR